MKVIIIHPRDISFDDLEALVFQYEYERSGFSQKVLLPSLPDHYLAYLVLQSIRLPLERRRDAIRRLQVDHDFFDWAADTYGGSHLAQRKPSLKERWRGNETYGNKGLSLFQRDILFALDSIGGRSQRSMSSQAGVPPLALEQLAAGVIDYFDPLKRYIDPTSDFLNLLHRIEHERKKGEQDQALGEIKRKRSGAAAAVRAFGKALSGMLKNTRELPDNRTSCARPLNTIELLIENAAFLQNELALLFPDRSGQAEALTDDRLQRITEAVIGIHHTLIHDHSYNQVFRGNRELSIHIIDANICHPALGIIRSIGFDSPADVFFMISAMSAEQALGAAVGRALQIMGVPAARIAYGGMSLNAFIPREKSSISSAFHSPPVRSEMEKNAEKIFGPVHRPSLFFGFFDRPGAKAFLDDFLQGKRTVGCGSRMAQDGFWLDAVKRRLVHWHGRYVSSALGIPFADAYCPVMIQGSCQYHCDFCASLGSLALGNQRTAEDVFAQIKHDFEQMSWLRSNLGEGAERLRTNAFFRRLIDKANLLCGGNIMIVDDNLTNVHPWTLKKLGDYLQKEDIYPAVWSQMDINTVSGKEHREFIKRYVVSAFVGLEALRNSYLLGFKKRAALMAKKELKRRIDAAEEPEGDLARYLDQMQGEGETDALRKAYFVNLSRLADAGAVPLNALLIGVPGHEDAATVAREIVDFVDMPIKAFNIHSAEGVERELIRWVSDLPFMTYQANYFSIFAGSPDYNNFYPDGNLNGELRPAVKAFVTPGHPQYDASRMGGNFTHINQNAYRLLLRLTRNKKEYGKLGKFEPENGALAHYHVDKELSRTDKLLKAFLGSAVVTYVGKNHLPPLSAKRILQAYKSTIIMNAFRVCGRTNAEGLASIAPVMRWAMYRKYVKHQVNDSEIDGARELLAQYGFEIEDGNRIGMEELKGYAGGFPDQVYRANAIRGNRIDIEPGKGIARAYFEKIIGKMTA